MSAEKSGSKSDTLVKVVLVFFISLLSFSVGTFVGKQVSDSDHRRMALEGEYKGDRHVASTESKAESEPEKISDKEVESLTEEFVNKEKAAGSEQAAASETEESEDDATESAVDASGYKSYNREKSAETAKPAAATSGEKSKVAAKEEKPSKDKEATHEKSADGVAATAEKVAKGEAPSDGKKDERKPSSTLPSVASSAVGKYTIQVGSYAEEKEAKTHAAELKGKGWNAFYFAADVQGRTWYRVSVGLFNNMTSAKEFRAQFMKDANTKSAIVQKIIQ